MSNKNCKGRTATADLKDDDNEEKASGDNDDEGKSSDDDDDGDDDDDDDEDDESEIDDRSISQGRQVKEEESNKSSKPGSFEVVPQNSKGAFAR